MPVNLVCFVHITFGDRSLTSPLAFFYNLVSLKSHDCSETPWISPFWRWTSSDSVRGIFYLHLQDEFTQEGCASCHGIKANKRPILQQECVTPPPSPLWISNVSPHAEFIAPHETSRVVSCALRRWAESGFCCFTTGVKTPIWSGPGCWAVFPLVNYEQVLLSGLSGGTVVTLWQLSITLDEGDVAVASDRSPRAARHVYSQFRGSLLKSQSRTKAPLLQRAC